MSDPAWYAEPLVTFAEGILFLQAAGTVAAPTSADEVGFVTDVSIDHEPQTEDVDYLHLEDTRQNLNSYAHSASFTLRIHLGPNAGRTLLRNAVANKGRVKATLQLGLVEAEAEIDVLDQAIVTLNKTGGADGWTNEVTLSGAKWTPTEFTEEP